MRERITFFHPEGQGVDPEELDIQDVGLLGPLTEAAREDRLTLALEELPSELAELLRGVSEVHMRWASPLKYETVEPFSSRIPPGFHLSYAPLDGEVHNPFQLCSFLQIFGQLDCMTSEAFTNEHEGLTPRSSFFHFYQELEDLKTFIMFATTGFCPDADNLCRARIRGLHTAASLGASYDSTSKQLKITAFWPYREQHVAVAASPAAERTEVGIMTRNTNTKLDDNHIGVSGILTDLGEAKRPSPVMFDFPSRHWLSGAAFSSKFLEPTGLHPTLQLSITESTPPIEDAECSLHAYFTLPKTIFADRYQLADELFLASKNLTALRYTSLPVDLEAPAYTTKSWGSEVLLELNPPISEGGVSGAWTAEVPLHLRYLKPSESGHVDVELPFPAVFWACDSGVVQESPNPFDRTHLGYDELFPGSSVFHHVTPRPENGTRIMTQISVPVLKDEAAPWIGFGTSTAVALGFIWVLWRLTDVLTKAGYGDVPRKTASDSRKKKQ